jgi:hypothetical protein
MNKMMEQKLIAFWKYDTAPYVLSGEVLSFTAKGNVEIKGYDGYIFTPIKILPYEIGIEIADKIKEIGKDTRKREAEIHAECRNAVDKLLS